MDATLQQQAQGGGIKSLRPPATVPPLKSDFYTREIKSLTRKPAQANPGECDLLNIYYCFPDWARDPTLTN